MLCEFQYDMWLLLLHGLSAAVAVDEQDVTDLLACQTQRFVPMRLHGVAGRNILLVQLHCCCLKTPP